MAQLPGIGRSCNPIYAYYQGRIEPPKAARGHATSNSANIDSIVLNVTKNRDPRAACKTAHTIEVLISMVRADLPITQCKE